jgi:hypothetical protein
LLSKSMLQLGEDTIAIPVASSTDSTASSFQALNLLTA